MQRTPPCPRCPLTRSVFFATGFRPFFLLAAAFAVLSMGVWSLALVGVFPHTFALPGVAWHAHEMIWGFTVAVIAGFLLTAARNWTGLETASGPALAGLVALWVAGRVVLFFGAALPWWVVAAVDVSFLPALAWGIGRPLHQAKSERNFVFPVLLVILALANLAIHLEAAGVVGPVGPSARLVALDAIAWMMLLMGGRIVPMFTRNALPHAQVKTLPRVDELALASMAVLLALDVGMLGLPWLATAAAVAALIAGVLNGLRMVGWGTGATLRHPILWVLHLGFAWVPIALVLRGLSVFEPAAIPATLGTHALAVGGIGTLTLGMMSRVALGHTGRPLRVGRWIAGAYLLVTLAVFVRLGAALGPPGAVLSGWVASGVLFALAFGIYLVLYTPILLAPRADGRPG